jgi:proline iminopeptidase
MTRNRIHLCFRITLTVSLVAVSSAAVGAQDEPMRLVSVDGRPIAYHVIGDGPEPPVILISGGPGFDHRYLHLTTVWERLGVDRKVVFFDQPGTGRSYQVGDADTLTVRDVLTSIRRIQDELGAPRIVLLGHSWGGYVAMAFAAACSERTDRVILVGTAAANWTDTEFNFAPLFPDSLARGPSPADRPGRATIDLRRTLAMSFYDPTTRDRVLADLEGFQFSARTARLLRGDASRNDVAPRLASLNIPTLVSTGRFDANVAPRTSWKVHQAIKGSRFVVWERSGHYPMVEQPEQFAAVIKEFLRVPRPTAAESCELQ